MEVNGVANIHLIVDAAVEFGNMNKQTAAQIKEQLLLLERYMLAYADHCYSKKAGSYGALIVGVEEPLWHEVRENPELYPTGQERINNYKKQMAGEE
jgi:hypothetical protein